MNCFSHEGQQAAPGEVFSLDPAASRRVIEKLEAIKDRRNNVLVQRSLQQLQSAAVKSDENLIPYLIDCCHAYATVGEMVSVLKGLWGEFQEPVSL